MSVIRSENHPEPTANQSVKESVGRYERAKAGSLVGTAAVMWAFQQSPANEYARALIGANVMEATNNPLLVGASVGLATLAIEGASSIPVAKVMNDHSEKVERLKAKIGRAGKNKESSKVTDTSLALAVGSAAVVVKHHSLENDRTFEDDKKTVAKTAGGIAVFSAGIATALGGGLKYAEKVGLEDETATVLNIATDWRTYGVLLAGAVAYGQAKKGVGVLKRKAEKKTILNGNSFEVRNISSNIDIERALELEQKVWHEEGYGELDVYEKYIPQSRFFAAFEGEKCVGMNRLFAGAPELPPFAGEMPYHDEAIKADIEAGCGAGIIEEFGTVAVDKDHRSRKVFMDLCRISFRDAESRGVKMWGIIMEPRRVAMMNKHLGFTFKQVGPAIDYQGGDCAAHLMDFSEVHEHMRATKPELYDWFVNEPLN